MIRSSKGQVYIQPWKVIRLKSSLMSPISTTNNEGSVPATALAQKILQSRREIALVGRSVDCRRIAQVLETYYQACSQTSPVVARSPHRAPVRIECSQHRHPPNLPLYCRLNGHTSVTTVVGGCINCKIHGCRSTTNTLMRRKEKFCWLASACSTSHLSSTNAKAAASPIQSPSSYSTMV